MERSVVTAEEINQLFGSSDPSPLAPIGTRWWWLRGEEHSGLFVDLIHAQHINWGLYKAPSIDCFFRGKTAAGSPPLATLQISFLLRAFLSLFVVLLYFLSQWRGAAHTMLLLPAGFEWQTDRQYRYRDDLLS